MKYIQIARKLRVQRGPGNADLVSERPGKWANQGEPNERFVYSDDPETAPTLVDFDEHCRVDIPSMVRMGAIREYVEPKKGGRGGKATGK